MRRALGRLSLASLALLVVGWGCSIFDGDKCQRTSWCEGDTLKVCEEDDTMFGTTNTYVDSYPCDVMCLEWKDENGDKHGSCILSDEPCPEGVESFCRNYDLIECGSHGYPVNLESCVADYKLCVDSPVVPQAFCSYVDEHCDEEGAKRCYSYGDDPEQHDATYLECADGVWRKEGVCYGAADCLQLELGDGSSYEGCFFADEPCPSWAHESYCVGNNVGHCATTGFPESLGQESSCSTKDSHCLDLGDPKHIGEARCVKSFLPCDPDEVQLCIDNWICDCTEIGYPQALYWCNWIGEQCVVDEDGDADCE